MGRSGWRWISGTLVVLALVGCRGVSEVVREVPLERPLVTDAMVDAATLVPGVAGVLVGVELGEAPLGLLTEDTWPDGEAGTELGPLAVLPGARGVVALRATQPQPSMRRPRFVKIP